jgi:hypothetical protein
MKRGYTAERYKAIIDNIRRHMPDASISGDAIVGFPGELRPAGSKVDKISLCRTSATIGAGRNCHMQT